MKPPYLALAILLTLAACQGSNGGDGGGSGAKDAIETNVNRDNCDGGSGQCEAREDGAVRQPAAKCDQDSDCAADQRCSKKNICVSKTAGSSM